MSANVFGNSLITPAGQFIGFGSSEVDSVIIVQGTGDPNVAWTGGSAAGFVPAVGAVAAPLVAVQGSIAIQTDAPDLWQNTTGAAVWEKVGLQA